MGVRWKHKKNWVEHVTKYETKPPSVYISKSSLKLWKRWDIQEYRFGPSWGRTSQAAPPASLSGLGFRVWAITLRSFVHRLLSWDPLGGVSFQTRATPPTVKTEERQHGTPATHLSIANFPPERSPKTLWALTVEDNDVQLTSDENPVIVFKTKDFVFQVASRDLPSCSLSQQLHPSLSQPIVS